MSRNTVETMILPEMVIFGLLKAVKSLLGVREVTINVGF